MSCPTRILGAGRVLTDPRGCYECQKSHTENQGQRVQTANLTTAQAKGTRLLAVITLMGERRVSKEPYLVDEGRGIDGTVGPRLVIFANKHGLCKMNPDGTGLAEFVKPAHPAAAVTGIQRGPSAKYLDLT